MLFSTFANTRKGEWSEISAGSQSNSNLREQWACWTVRLLFRELGWAGRSEGGQESHEFGKGKCEVLWLGCDKPCSTTGWGGWLAKRDQPGSGLSAHMVQTSQLELQPGPIAVIRAPALQADICSTAHEEVKHHARSWAKLMRQVLLQISQMV